jgi:uncharacterized protein YjiS (DUF1127 family)
MTAKSDVLQPMSIGAVDWVLHQIATWAADLRDQRRRNASNRVIQALSSRQLRDVGIDTVYETRRKEAAAKAVLLANLLSLR